MLLWIVGFLQAAAWQRQCLVWLHTDAMIVQAGAPGQCWHGVYRAQGTNPGFCFKGL